MGIRGSVDIVSSTEITGWAFAPTAKESLVVQALLNHEILGDAVANVLRADLRAAGLGSGKCGFTITLNRPIDPLYLPFVVVRPEGGDVEFPRTTLSGFADFFRVVNAGFPMAGRHRSVHGGLWTDRTDAAALLRGKLAVGQVKAGTEHALSQLIHDGYAVVQIENGLLRNEASNITIERMAQIIDAPKLMEIVRAILEDLPVVLGAEDIDAAEQGLTQASTATDLLSPAETIAIVAPKTGKAIGIDVLRDGHKLPEFTADGRSRWVQPLTEPHQHEIAPGGSLDRINVSPGSVAIFGPGTFQRVRSIASSTTALRMMIAPSRAVSAARALSDTVEYNSSGGTRILKLGSL